MPAFRRCALFLLLAGVAGLASAQNNKDPDRVILEQSAQDEGTTSAPPRDDDDDLSTTYSAIGLSRVAADFSNVKEAVNLDITLIGFRIPTVKWFAVELNLGFTMIPGEVERPGSGGTSCSPFEEALGLCTPTSGTSSSTSDFGATTAAAYAVLRSPGKVYGMGRLGYRYLDSSLPELDDDRSGTAWGLGVGYRYNTWGGFAELHYTQIAEAIDGIGFTLSYGYGGR